MAPGVSRCRYVDVPLSLSFSGCGFMATYQLGVTQCFITYAPWILRTAPCVLGASAGSLAAAAVVCEISPITIRDEMLHFAEQLKAFTLGPFNPSVNVHQWLECFLHKRLPSDAHQLASGRLGVSMTRLTDGKQIVMSQFQSREELVQALLCSCFVPGYCGMMPPSFKGVHYIDGGFTSMQPVMTGTCSQTLTVSPFSGDTDICPADIPAWWDMVVSGTTIKGNMANSLRVLNALFPLALETLEQAYHSGYKDAIRFLLHNSLDFAPYITIHKQTQVALNNNQTQTWMPVKTPVEEEEEEEEMKVKKKKASLASFVDNTHMQMMLMDISTGNQETEEPPLHFDMINNVLLGNVVTYLSMLGLPEKILFYLFLPLMLWFYVVLQGRQRIELMFRQGPELLFWTWCSLRCFFFFLSDIFVLTLKKNLMDRVFPSSSSFSG